MQLCLLLQSLHFNMLSEAWRAQPSLDIVAVGVQLLRDRVRLMVDLLRAGLVKTEVRQGGAAAHTCCFTERHNHCCQAFHREHLCGRGVAATGRCVLCFVWRRSVAMRQLPVHVWVSATCRCTLVPCSWATQQ